MICYIVYHLEQIVYQLAQQRIHHLHQYILRVLSVSGELHSSVLRLVHQLWILELILLRGPLEV